MSSTSGYRTDEREKTPQGWDMVSLGDLVSLEYGVGLPESKRLAGKYPVYGSNGIIGHHNEALIKGPGIIVGRKGSIGRVSWAESDFWPIDITYSVLLRRKDVSMKWLFYKLNQMKLSVLNAATGVPGLNRNEAYALKLTRPPPQEQQKIAFILSTVDDSIQKSNQIIATTHQLKIGLLQQLFSRGIGHTSFKQTELGEIPKEWEVVYFKQVVRSYRNGIYKPSSFYGRGIPSVRMYNIKDGKVNKAKAPLLDVTKPELIDYGLKPGDILINRVNSIDQVGKAGIVQDDLGDATFESKNIRVRVSPDKCNPPYLAYFLCTSLYLKQIRSIIKPAVAQATINQDDLDQIQICMPPLSEQQEIVSILSTLDERIETEMQRKEQVEHLKKGLMNDLLTGKVRVKVT